MATMLNNADGAWNDDKKYIENCARGWTKLPDGSKKPTRGAACHIRGQAEKTFDDVPHISTGSGDRYDPLEPKTYQVNVAL